MWLLIENYHLIRTDDAGGMLTYMYFCLCEGEGGGEREGGRMILYLSFPKIHVDSGSLPSCLALYEHLSRTQSAMVSESLPEEVDCHGVL